MRCIKVVEQQSENSKSGSLGFRRRLRILVASCLLLVQLHAPDALADLFENRMSMDKTLVEFTVGPTRYRIPRNYIYKMDDWSGGVQRLVSLRVQYPGFAAYSGETAACFTKHAPCQLIEIHILLPDSGLTEYTFLGNRRFFQSEMPEKTESGYDWYKSGPETARLDFYRKQLPDRLLVFMCQPFQNRGMPDGTCGTIIRIQSGGQLSYSFPLRHLGDAEQLDAGVRSLVESFIVGDDK